MSQDLKDLLEEEEKMPRCSKLKPSKKLKLNRMNQTMSLTPQQERSIPLLIEHNTETVSTLPLKTFPFVLSVVRKMEAGMKMLLICITGKSARFCVPVQLVHRLSKLQVFLIICSVNANKKPNSVSVMLQIWRFELLNLILGPQVLIVVQLLLNVCIALFVLQLLRTPMKHGENILCSAVLKILGRKRNLVENEIENFCALLF
jgi:hypothetical protein